MAPSFSCPGLDLLEAVGDLLAAGGGIGDAVAGAFRALARGGGEAFVGPGVSEQERAQPIDHAEEGEEGSPYRSSVC